MRLAPRSLFGRNAALLVGLILLSQALTLLFFAGLVVYPQARRISDIVAQSVSAISTTLNAVPRDQRAALIAELDRSPYLDIAPGDQPPRLADGSPTPLERFFMQELVDRLRTQTELEWRVSHGRAIWVGLELGGERYWVASRAPSAVEPILAGLMSITLVSSLALAFGLMLTRQLARPLESLKAAADGLSLGAPPAPIDVKGPSEIQALAGSFNRMIARLGEAEKERAFVLAGISHDVRTPLAKLCLALEMIPSADDLRSAAVRQVEHIDRLLRQFLDYARGFDVEPVRTIDLAQLAREAARDSGLDPDASVDAPRALTIEGRQEALRRALANLIENAMQHGAPPVRIEVTATQDGACVRVRDCGDGIKEGASEVLKEPFRRGDGAAPHSGSGLGLAIVDRIARLHGGALDLRNDPSGGVCASLSVR